MPAAAGSVGDRDVAEAVEERVARAARPAVPALDVTVEDVEGVERTDQRGDAVGMRRGPDACIRIAAAVAAGDGPRGAAEGDGRDGCSEEEKAEGLRHVRGGRLQPRDRLCG